MTQSSGRTSLTKRGLTRTLDRLEVIGLLDHLPVERRAEIRAGLFERFLTGPQEILEAIPDLVVGFGQDDGTYGGGQPYAEQIRRFADASRGAFVPTDITDTFSYEADSARVGFSIDGARYETTVPANDWLYATFVSLIADAMRDRDVRLYRLGTSPDQGYAFLSTTQWAELATLGLLADGVGPADPDEDR